MFIFEVEFDIVFYVVEVLYFVIDDINIIVGICYIDEICYICNIYIIVDGVFMFDVECDFDDILLWFVVSYDVNNNWNVYVNYVRGWCLLVVDVNVGGVNVIKFEIVDSYDLGIKY